MTDKLLIIIDGIVTGYCLYRIARAIRNRK